MQIPRGDGKRCMHGAMAPPLPADSISNRTPQQAKSDTRQSHCNGNLASTIVSLALSLAHESDAFPFPFLCLSPYTLFPPSNNPTSKQSVHLAFSFTTYIRQNILRLITRCSSKCSLLLLASNYPHLHTIMADIFRPRFGRLGSIARMEPPPPPAPAAPAPTPAPAAPAPTPAPPTTSTARPSTRPQLQPQPTGLFRGTASVPSSPILPARPAPSDITSVPTSVPTSPIPMATIITTTAGTSSLPQSPAKPSTAAAAGTSSFPQSPVKQLNGPTSGTSSLPQSPAKLPPPPAPMAPLAPLAPPTRVQSPPMTYTPKSFTRVSPSSSPPRSSPKKLVASPKTIKSTSPPPSPLRLPPSQITADPEPEPTKRQLLSTPAPPPSPQHKAKVLHEHDKIMESTKVVHNKAQELPRHHSSTKPHSKSWASSDEESGLRMINIAGENRGAFMELLPSSSSSTPGSPMKSKPLHGEEAAKVKKDGKGGAGTLSPLSAFVNSNVQGVNNSILLNASCAHKSPGVHLAVTRRPSGKAKDLAVGEGHHA